jgi:hypothetical protein
MKTYKVTFTNVAPITVNATNRQDAIRQAIAQTRGYLSVSAQRTNIISCKLA